MNEEILFKVAVTFIPAIFILFLGAIVYFHDRKSVSNFLFLLISLASMLWSVANYFSIDGDSIWSVRSVIFFAVPHIALFVLFLANFPERKFIINKKFIIIFCIITIVVSALTLSPYIFSELTFDSGITKAEAGELIPLLAIFFIGSLIASIYFIAKRFIKGSHYERIKWGALLIGSLVTYISLILTQFILTNFFNNFGFILYGPMFMLPLILGVGYAIIKHGLLRVRVIATESVTFVLLIILFVQIFISNGNIEMVLNIIIFIIFFIFAILLIRSIIREVERRKQVSKLATELKRANEELKELDQAKSDFMNIASHQLRTPLSGIIGYLSMVIEEDYGKVAKDQKKILSGVFTASRRLSRLVDTFLNVSRIEAGKFFINLQTVSIEDVLETEIGEMSFNAKDKKIKLIFERSKKPLPKIKLDIDKIKDVIINLIDNAIKYTSKGSVTVSAMKEGKFIHVKIKDTGVGIPTDQVDKLFSKFFRARGIAKIQPDGSGLGLYIAKRIVEAHEGRIWVESDGLGKGTTFQFMIPLNPKVRPAFLRTRKIIAKTK